MPAPMSHHRRRGPGPRAVLRLFGLGMLIVEGLATVSWRFPVLGPEQRRQRVQRWSRRVLRVLGIELRVQGRLAPGARLLVLNHLSWLDVMVLHALCPEARFVAKADVRRWPLVGPLVAGAGTVFVDRDRPLRLRQAADEVVAVLRGGGTVALFPEGTTSDGRDVLPFRRGLLGSADRAGCPVQAIALRYVEPPDAISPSVPYIGDDTLLQSMWRLCRAGGIVASVTMLQPRGATAAGRLQLAAQLRADIRSALAGGKTMKDSDGS